MSNTTLTLKYNSSPRDDQNNNIAENNFVSDSSFAGSAAEIINEKSVDNESALDDKSNKLDLGASRGRQKSLTSSTLLSRGSKALKSSSYSIDSQASSEKFLDDSALVHDKEIYGKKSLQANQVDDLAKILELKSIKKKSIEKLVEFAKEMGIDNVGDFGRQDMIYHILKNFSDQNPENVIIGEGVLEVLEDGFGFLRAPETNYFPGSDDIYVSPSQIKRFGLRTGDTIKGQIRGPKKGEKYFALLRVHQVNDDNMANPDRIRNRVFFDDLTPLYPSEKLNLELDTNPLDETGISTRMIDLFAPLGKGQRALIVAPPRTGKTLLMQNIAHAITSNHPEITLLVLLIDERPEEVTDMSRTINGEVVSSTFDEPALRHVQLAEMVIEKARRLVEAKKDVVILLDSITRLARAYNTVIPSSGKVLSGGVDSNALQKPKRFFGAARNVEEGGSLTIIATALIETGSRMEEVIFEEFKGTGNSEIVLDRKLADRRIFPALDITKSGTRKEELLVGRESLLKMWVLRKLISQMTPIETMDFVLEKVKNSKTNDDFFKMMNS